MLVGPVAREDSQIGRGDDGDGDQNIKDEKRRSIHVDLSQMP
jgi:hypothetical protein